MQFAFPTFLWGLLALAIPVIIHLFHFRRFKKVYFTNVHLLKELKEETSSRNKIKNLLVLLARMLAFMMLVLAFAQPILKGDGNDDNRAKLVSVFVDNSFSMNATKGEVQLLRLAKDRAGEILNTYSEEDRFLILTHDLEAKHQRIVDRSTALGFIEEIGASPQVQNLEDVLNVTDRISSNQEDFDRRTFLISDFQENICVFGTQRDSTVEINLLPVRAAQESNVSLEACFFEAPIPVPDQSNKLIVRLSNYGPQPNDVQLNLLYQDQSRPQGVVSLEANSTVYDTIQIPVNGTGWHQFELAIDDYPVEFDDKLYGSFEIKDRIDILSLYEAASNTYLPSVFESIDYYQLEQVNKQSVRYDEFVKQELIILDDLVDLSSGLIAELSTYVRQGGNLLIFPSINANTSAYNELFDRLQTDRYKVVQNGIQQVSTINEDDFTFQDVFVSTSRAIRLPVTQSNFIVENIQSRNSVSLLQYRNGDPYLFKHAHEKGNAYICVAPLNRRFNDLVLNAEIFVPMLYRMALSSGVKKPVYYTIGTDESIPIDLADDVGNSTYEIRGKTEFIPGLIRTNRKTELVVQDQISQDGLYDFYQNDNLMALLAFNYNRLESDVRMGDMDRILSEIGKNVKLIEGVALADLSGFIVEKHQGIRLWRWCLIFALFFLLVETLLLRFWK